MFHRKFVHVLCVCVCKIQYVTYQEFYLAIYGVYKKHCKINNRDFVRNAVGLSMITRCCMEVSCQKQDSTISTATIFSPDVSPGEFPVPEIERWFARMLV